MKCPFLIRRRDVINKEGKKISEDIEILECIKNDCMVYDGATKLCSLLSSNIKTGVMIDDFKNGIKAIKEEIFQRTESIGVIISTTVQTIQDALLGRFDILKKQNEVIVLGFDRLTEIFNNRIAEVNVSIQDLNRNTLTQIINAQTKFSEEFKNIFSEYRKQMENTNNIVVSNFDRLTDKISEINTNLLDFNKNTSALKDHLVEIIKENNEKIINSFTTLKDVVTNQGDNFKSSFETFQGIGKQIVDGQIRFTEEIKALFVEYTKQIEKANENFNSRFDLLKADMERLITTNQVGMEAISNQIEKSLVASQEISKKVEPMEHIINSINSVTDFIKGELATIKADGLNVLASLWGKFDDLNKVISESTKAQEEHLIGKFDELGKVFAETMKVQEERLRDLISANEAIKAEINGVREGASGSQKSLAEMSNAMSELNRNYLESLGKIAGLAEGMRKGVDKVGEDMNKAVKNLVDDLREQLGSVEKQYEKTFKDIATLADKFEGLNNRIAEMTREIQKEFKDSLERQTKLSDFTREILIHMREYFEKEEARYKEEHVVRKRKEAIDHFDRATLYFYRGNYELALNEIEKALEIDKTAEYLNLKGLLLTELARTDEAKNVYQEALKLEPNLAEIYNNLGVLYLKTRKLEDAITSFQEAIKRNVNYALAYVHLGKTLMELEKYDEALNTYQKALEIDPANKEAKEAIELYREGKVG